MSAITDKATQLDELLHTAVQDDKQSGVFRCRRDIFTNADLFELEMKHIFESNWVYLAHESQIPNNNDTPINISTAPTVYPRNTACGSTRLARTGR